VADSARVSSDADIGTVRSTHRPRIASLLWLLVLVVFLDGAALALIAVAIDQHETVEVLKRLGGAALFGAGGLALMIDFMAKARTHVDVGEHGLRITRGGAVIVRWTDIRMAELGRANGKPAWVTLHVGESPLSITSALRDFDAILAALRERGLLPRG
jgi:hypothetical protein